MEEPFIHMTGLTKRFGTINAVDAAELEIRRGEFFSLLGPSGCGKTTLLRMIAGFEHPSEGEIYIDGKLVTDMPPNLRPTNMVFQSYAVFPHLNVFDNIAYGLRKKRLPRAALTGRVEEALAMIKLDGFAKRRVDQLSGGQRQRVALARALVCRPKVLLLDEPLGALDKRLREAMQIELRQLQRDVGITFIFVTHDQEEALSMSDRIAVMANGKVLQISDPRTLYEKPNCREVADFIGTINFFDGTITGFEDHYATIDAGALGQINAAAHPDEAPFAHKAGSKVVIALRPEKIKISREIPETGALHGVITASAYLGDRNHFHITIAARNEPIAVAAQNFLREGTNIPKPGEAVHISWPPDAMVLLPRD